jgi:hypothetical protein
MAGERHRAMAAHVKATKQHIANASDSMDKIEQVLAALKGQQEEPTQPASPGMTNAGISPLGGQAK